MKISGFLREENAVSPVIGVILMVAITVILAAVIGAFVLNLGEGLNQSAPQASFSFDYADDSVDVTHESGDTIDADRLNVTSSASIDYANSEPFADSVGAGDTATYDLDTGQWSGETVRVVWESADGSSSATLSRSTAPTID